MNDYSVYAKSDQIKELYVNGNSCQEIKDKLQLPVSVRQVQRYIKKWGLTRNPSESFRLAIAKGRVKFWKKPITQQRKTLSYKIRLYILQRDNFTCVYCGNTAKEARIQVDHIDNNPMNNDLTNLQTLCEPCNKGKVS